jgi:hypothetical protein
MKRSLVCRMIENVLLLCEDKETPADWEWDECLGLLTELKAKCQASGAQGKVLVATLGGGPNAAQRKRLEAVLGGHPMPVAVISDSLKLRFITAAVALFNADHRAFSTAERLQAYKHLGLNTSQTRQLEAAISQMEKMVAPGAAEPKRG